jgi:hypothetical protein
VHTLDTLRLQSLMVLLMNVATVSAEFVWVLAIGQHDLSWLVSQVVWIVFLGNETILWRASCATLLVRILEAVIVSILRIA